MATNIGEIFIELGIVGDDREAKKVLEAIDKVKKHGDKAADKLQKLQQHLQKIKFKQGKTIANNLKNIGSNISTVVTAVSGAIVALNKLSDTLVQQNQYWINLTRNSDIALSTYQKWGVVGAALDRTLGMQGAAGAIADLNERLFELKLTGEGARGFQLAGIMPTTAEDVLEQLRSRVAGMNDTAATYLLKQMGIDPRMLAVLRMTRAEFNALNAELEKYQLTMEQRKQIQEFHKQMSIVNTKMQYFKDRILIALMPHLERIMKFVVKAIEALPKFRGYIIGLGLILTKIKPIAKYSKYIFSGMTGLISKIPIIGRLFGSLGGIIARAFLPLTAAYLLLEDFAVFQEGGESVIGDIINYFKQMGEDFFNLGKIFSTKPLEAFIIALYKIQDIYIKIAQSILNTIDTFLGTPLGKWFRKYYGGEEYDEKMKEMSEYLRDTAREIDEEKLAISAVPNINNYNNGNNDNSKQVNITQNNNITTTQPAQTIYGQLGLTYQAALFG